MSDVNPLTPSPSDYGRLLNFDQHLVSGSNSSLFNAIENERNYSLFNDKDWPTLASPRSRIPPIESLSLNEINQIQEGLKKLFGIQSQAPARPEPIGKLSPGATFSTFQSGCGLPTCRTMNCATAQESRLNASFSGFSQNGRATNLNNSWPILDTDFTYSIGPNVQRQIENSVVYNPIDNSSEIPTAAEKVARWTRTNSKERRTKETNSAVSLNSQHQSLNRDKMRCVISNSGRRDMVNDPTVLYRFYQFECPCNKKIWFSPLDKAKDGLFCWACTHFVKPFAHFDGTTPYQGSELCYGKFECHVCKNTWSSRRSMANTSENCFGCGASIYPYYQVTLTIVEKKKRRVEAVTALREGLGGAHRHTRQVVYSLQNSPSSQSPRQEASSCESGTRSSHYYPSLNINNQLCSNLHSNYVNDHEPGIGTPQSSPRQKSPLVISISSPALIQKKKNGLT